MKLIGLMVVRNEEWILAASIDAAMKWCDGLVILNHGSTDTTSWIINNAAYNRYYDNIQILRRTDVDQWDEMDHRQATLDAGREMGGTHFAIVDADEILTDNLVPLIREPIEKLYPAHTLGLPMIAVWRDVDHYRNDDCVWTKAEITLAFADDPKKTLCWKPTVNGYHHHHRTPHGFAHNNHWKLPRGVTGGVMHLQFACHRRLLAKHVWYRMMEFLRYKKPATALNIQYDQALDESRLQLRECPGEWWDADVKKNIHIGVEPWHEKEIARLLQVHGRQAFKGLDLKGF